MLWMKSNSEAINNESNDSTSRWHNIHSFDSNKNEQYKTYLRCSQLTLYLTRQYLFLGPIRKFIQCMEIKTHVLGISMTVWYLAGNADGPPPTSMYLLLEFCSCILLRSWASSNVSSRLAEEVWVDVLCRGDNSVHNTPTTAHEWSLSTQLIETMIHYRYETTRASPVN